MRSIILAVLFWSIAANGQTTTPSTSPLSAAELLSLAENELKTVEKTATDELNAKPDYQKLKNEVADLELALEQARTRGTTEQRMQASSKFNKTREQLKKLEVEFLNSHEKLSQAKLALEEAKKNSERESLRERRKRELLAQKQREEQEAKDALAKVIKRTDDPFEDEVDYRTVYLETKTIDDSPWTLKCAIKADIPKKIRASDHSLSIVFENQSGQQILKSAEEAGTVSFLLNDKERVVLPVAGYTGKLNYGAYGNYWNEFVSVQVPISALDVIEKADRISARVGFVDCELPKIHVELLKVLIGETKKTLNR